jgi:hypothetical protein
MKFLDDFLCTESINIEEPFSGGDTIELYKKNLKEQPEDWLYRTKSITYKYNSHGFRCTDIKDLDFDNYILFTGCSHTEGVGLELEDTYPYKVSKHFNTDYYNLAVGGSGLDVLEHNLITWFLKFKKKPKYVFIQWPDHSRYAGVFPNYENILLMGSWHPESKFKDFMAAGEITGFFHSRKYLTSRLLSNVIDVPIFNVQYSALSSFQTYDFLIKKIDLARDLAHSGIKTNQIITDQIIQTISMR